ncbi:MAG TPA: AAA family ATPase [Thermoplasmata archaeon]|nr:AAA family ATPase [Thermoplasmata archaeon]
MLRPAHPEVLATDWLPPVPLYRRREVEAATDALRSALRGDGPPVTSVVGPSGSGTSTVARLAARAAYEELRRSTGGNPLLAMVRVRGSHGAWGVATALLYRLDDGFSGRGFRVTEIAAGFLRRLRRDRRPLVLVLDDIAPAVGDLSVLLTALLDPDRFLPEGESGMPPRAAVLAGVPEAAAVWSGLVRHRLPRGTRIDLPPLGPAAIDAIVRDRAARVLGRPVPETDLAELLLGGPDGSLSLAERIERMRRAFRVPAPGPPTAPIPGARAPLEIEPRLAGPLERLARQRRATIAEMRAWERECAEAEGRPPLPATTFWRRIVRLESEGVVHREVRAGGAGGTRSVVELTRPLPDGPAPPGTPRAGGWP